MTSYLYMLWMKVENSGQVRFVTDQIHQLNLRKPSKKHVDLKYLYALTFKDRRAVYIGSGSESRVVSRISGKPLELDNDELALYSQQALDGDYLPRQLVLISAYWLPGQGLPDAEAEKYEKARWYEAGWGLLNQNDMYQPSLRFKEVPKADWFSPWHDDFQGFGKVIYRRYGGCPDRGLSKNKARLWHYRKKELILGHCRLESAEHQKNG